MISLQNWLLYPLVFDIAVIFFCFRIFFPRLSLTRDPNDVEQINNMIGARSQILGLLHVSPPSDTPCSLTSVLIALKSI